MQDANHHHATDEVIEQYAMGHLTGVALVEFEEHLLFCETCQNRLAAEDAFQMGICDAGRATLQPSAPRIRQVPRVAWGLALAAGMILVLCAGVLWRASRHSFGPAAVITLQAMRGASAAADLPSAGQPLHLALDITGLPAERRYAVEIVDAAGHAIFSSEAISHDGKLAVVLATGLHAGNHFVRIYSPGRELLREYALSVRR